MLFLTSAHVHHTGPSLALFFCSFSSASVSTLVPEYFSWFCFENKEIRLHSWATAYYETINKASTHGWRQISDVAMWIAGSAWAVPSAYFLLFKVSSSAISWRILEMTQLLAQYLHAYFLFLLLVHPKAITLQSCMTYISVNMVSTWTKHHSCLAFQVTSPCSLANDRERDTNDTSTERLQLTAKIKMFEKNNWLMVQNI